MTHNKRSNQLSYGVHKRQDFLSPAKTYWPCVQHKSPTWYAVGLWRVGELLVVDSNHRPHSFRAVCPFQLDDTSYTGQVEEKLEVPAPMPTFGEANRGTTPSQETSKECVRVMPSLTRLVNVGIEPTCYSVQ